MSFSGIILGLINIAIVIAIFLLVGALIVWGLSFFQMSVPENVRKLYLLIVALIALYMIVALLFGIPTVHIITRHQQPRSMPQLAPTPSIIQPERQTCAPHYFLPCSSPHCCWFLHAA